MKDTKFVNIGFDRALIDAIDAFRYKNCFPTRVEAIRWLLEYALKQKPKKDGQ